MSQIDTQLMQTGGPSKDFILSQYAYLKNLFGERNDEFRKLRDTFDGNMQSMQESKSKPALMQDRPVLTYNIVNATIRRYMDSMSQPPRIEGVPEGFDSEDVVKADIRSKWLEHVWADNNMSVLLTMAAHDQALFDKAVFLVRPCPLKKSGLKIELIVPEYYYPMPSGDDWFSNPFVIIGFRSFDGNAISSVGLDPLKTVIDPVFNNKVIFLSEKHYVEIENNEETLRISHDWGFIPVAVAHNIPIPHRERGQGDVDQVIGLQSYLNMMFSDMADIINYAANPIAVVRGSKAGGANLPFAPRAVWELERDAQVGFLQWSGTPPAFETQLLRTIQAIEDGTGVSSPAFGREIPSGVSGSAVRSLLAGFNTRLGTKQQMMGEALAKVNVFLQAIAEKELGGKKYQIVGEIMDQKGESSFRKYEVKPSEFKGWYANKIVFAPEDPTATFFQEMEKYNKGIQSRYTTMRNLSIKNISDELERIKREKAGEAEQANNMALAQQGQLPEPMPSPEDIEKMLGPAQMPKPGQLEGPGMAAPGGPIGPEGSGDAVTSGDVAQRLKAAGIMGNATVTGELADKGATTGPIEILLDDRNDEAKVYKALAGLGEVSIKYRDINKPPKPEESPLARGLLQRRGTETREVDEYLRVAVLSVQKTNTGAEVYVVGVRDGEDTIPIAKTFPQARVLAKQGQLISIHISGLTRREMSEGINFTLVKPEVVKSPTAPATISTPQDLDRMWQKGKPTNAQEA